MAPQHGYRVEPQELAEQVTTLAKIGDQLGGLVGSANRMAEQLPMLGTAPPAIHLAMRLRDEAGTSGLTGEVTAADTEMNSFHRALKAGVAGYLENEDDAVRTLRTIDGVAE